MMPSIVRPERILFTFIAARAIFIVETAFIMSA